MRTTNTLCESYWRKTGYKFYGTDEELENQLATCGKQMEFSDEEGYFNSFLCTIDFKKCDKCCNKHNPRLDEDWKPFIDSVNQRFEQCG